MQYIEKEPAPPTDWDDWFGRSGHGQRYDYRTAQQKGTLNTLEIKRHLVDEQHGLCAYCQKKLLPGNKNEDHELQWHVSIEHVIPDSPNKAYSTDYHNLVAVCNNNPKGTNGAYCEAARGNTVIPSLVFYSDCQVTVKGNHPYFAIQTDGSVVPASPKPKPVQDQANAFIEVLQLNEPVRRRARKQALNALIDAADTQPDRQERKRFLQGMFNSYIKHHSREFRQFLLIWLKSKI